MQKNTLSIVDIALGSAIEKTSAQAQRATTAKVMAK